VYHIFNGADIELQDLIVREIRIASGSKVDTPTGNKVAEQIGGIDFGSFSVVLILSTHS
jgi:hypothetical protein